MRFSLYPYPFRAGDSIERQRGFTLLELVVVMGILGLIAGMAYPAYTRYLQTSLRTDAHAGLRQAAAELARCHARTYTYQECEMPRLSPSGHYRLAYSERQDSRYVLSASTERKDGCGQAITLSSQGERLPETCW